MSKNGKPVTKHIVGLGNVTSYEDVPDAREASMYQERPKVDIAGGQKAATQTVGDEYHQRAATAEELKAATAKTLAANGIAGAHPAPTAPKSRSDIASMIVNTISGAQKHNVPVADGHTHPHISDNVVTGDEADNAPNGQSEKKKAKLGTVKDNTDLDKQLTGEIDKVEPVDERYGNSAEPIRNKKIMHSLAAGDRVYVPGVKAIGHVLKSELGTLTVELESGTEVRVDMSEVTPLDPEPEGKGYASDSLKKKNKKKVGPNGMTVDASTDSKPTKSEADDDEDPKD